MEAVWDGSRRVVQGAVRWVGHGQQGHPGSWGERENVQQR